MIMETITTNGYIYLFLLSFLAATIIPLGSEWLLATLVVQGLDPALLLPSATAGNVLGACTTYAIGLAGGTWCMEKLLRINATTRKRAERIYARYGSLSLLFSWLPLIGDPLCLVGGLFRIKFAQFAILVLAGKLARYAVVILGVQQCI
jgi:membrane protein YqaA with SNARE-associated domain